MGEESACGDAVKKVVTFSVFLRKRCVMNISLSINRASTGAYETTGAANAAAKGSQVQAGSSSLTVSSGAPASFGDIEGVSEEVERSLVRDDALGRLFSSAFNLTAPPMPAFQTE